MQVSCAASLPSKVSNLCVQEAERLAETYSGAECMSVSLGPSRRAPPTAASYIGRGAVAQLRGVLEEADPEK